MPFLQLTDLPEKELVPGCRVRFVHSRHMTLAYYNIRGGSLFPKHSHPHEQVSNVIAGEFELTVEDESRVLRAGVVAIIPPHAQHHGRAITDCRIIDVFYPVREDYR